MFGFLTTDANDEVAKYHSKAMPVVLTTEEERELWMSDAPWSEVHHLQDDLWNGLKAGSLQVVAQGSRQDGGPISDRVDG